MTDYTAELKSFDDTAAFVSALDLVITVCTSVAHLSGAIGQRTWVLLDVNPHWTWLLERRDSPWYPTATLYRQRQFRRLGAGAGRGDAGSGGARRPASVGPSGTWCPLVPATKHATRRPASAKRRQTRAGPRAPALTSLKPLSPLRPQRPAPPARGQSQPQDTPGTDSGHPAPAGLRATLASICTSSRMAAHASHSQTRGATRAARAIGRHLFSGRIHGNPG